MHHQNHKQRHLAVVSVTSVHQHVRCATDSSSVVTWSMQHRFQSPCSSRKTVPQFDHPSQCHL